MAMKLHINAKCGDCCRIIAEEPGKPVIAQIMNYVPRKMGIGGGDYLRLVIDNETGRVENWKPLTREELEEQLSQ